MTKYSAVYSMESEPVVLIGLLMAEMGLLNVCTMMIWFFLLLLCRLYGINVCGEGGEYETMTLDCPLFRVSFHLRLLFNGI